MEIALEQPAHARLITGDARLELQSVRTEEFIPDEPPPVSGTTREG